AVLFTACAVLLGWIVVHWLLRPLGALTYAMRLIERGDYQRIAGTQDARLNELRLLHRGLDAMWRGLERRRNQRDAALLASDAARQQMRSVLDRMDEGFMILDASWQISFCNQRGALLVGQPDADLSGQLFWALFPDEADETGRGMRCQREIEFNRSYVVEDFHARYKRWLEMRLFPSPGGVGVFLRDVSGRRKLIDELVEREQRYRELFEANPNVMWIYDTETLRFLAVNGAAVQRYGYTQQEFLAMSIADIRPLEDREELSGNFSQENEEEGQDEPSGIGLGRAGKIWRHVTSSGEVILVEVARHPTVFKGRPARLVMVNDVTVRLMGESRLRRRHERLSAEHAELGRIARVAQQMLSGTTRLLQEELLPLLAHAAQQPQAGELGLRANGLVGLLHEVHQLAQLPRAPFFAESVDLSALATEEVRRLRQAWPEREVHVEIAAPLRCNADAALVRLLVRALLDNAWKFSAQGRNPWIRIGRLERPDSPDAAFYVSDNGIGFDEAWQGRAYLPFERLHSEAEFAGHGLGLALARAVVARHHGRLWAHATPGQGSTFCFELAPRAEDTAFRVNEVVIDSLPADDD
ncbi:MAG: ATP-binding protein, partial [Ramlibacter sp.]